MRALVLRRHGSLAGIELTYMGYRGMNLESRELPMAPTARPVPYSVPIAARTMDKADIRNVRRWLRDHRGEGPVPGPASLA